MIKTQPSIHQTPNHAHIKYLEQGNFSYLVGQKRGIVQQTQNRNGRPFVESHDVVILNDEIHTNQTSNGANEKYVSKKSSLLEFGINITTKIGDE